MEPVLAAQLPIHTCAFRPRHRNNLSNDFRCFATFTLPRLGQDTA